MPFGACRRRAWWVDGRARPVGSVIWMRRLIPQGHAASAPPVALSACHHHTGDRSAQEPCGLRLREGKPSMSSSRACGRQWNVLAIQRSQQETTAGRRPERGQKARHGRSAIRRPRRRETRQQPLRHCWGSGAVKDAQMPCVRRHGSFLCEVCDEDAKSVFLAQPRLRP